MKRIITAIIAIIMGGFMVVTPVLLSEPTAAAHCALTATLGNSKCDKDGNENPSGNYNCSCDNGGGSSVLAVLTLVVNVMSVAIGILAAIGIAIVGTQYLTAGGNEEKTRKAKRRLFEIIIGVVAYVLIYALLKWLMPGF